MTHLYWPHSLYSVISSSLGTSKKNIKKVFKLTPNWKSKSCQLALRSWNLALALIRANLSNLTISSSSMEMLYSIMTGWLLMLFPLLFEMNDKAELSWSFLFLVLLISGSVFTLSFTPQYSKVLWSTFSWDFRFLAFFLWFEEVLFEV